MSDQRRGFLKSANKGNPAHWSCEQKEKEMDCEIFAVYLKKGRRWRTAILSRIFHLRNLLPITYQRDNEV
jgi:hypothetical protein